MRIAAIKSIRKVVFFFMSFTELSALGSFKVTPSINKDVNLLFDVSLLCPSAVARLKGIGDSGYVKAAGRSITRSFAMEKGDLQRTFPEQRLCLDCYFETHILRSVERHVNVAQTTKVR